MAAVERGARGSRTYVRHMLCRTVPETAAPFEPSIASRMAHEAEEAVTPLKRCV